ncbi:MAG: D-glycero-beta-D-manno-heptose 1,7-bisphosphate 7-phosphatase [Campylobacterales bacterium]
MDHKALFLDRDGVINIEKNYLYKSEDFEFIDGVFEALRMASEAGFLLVVITNQSGIGRGYYTQEDFDRLTDWMRGRLAHEGIVLSGVYFCPHAPEVGCDCRKPAPGMIVRAIKELGIDPKSSWFVGDKEIDIKAANAAGVNHTILVRSGHVIDERATKATWVKDDLLEAVRSILNTDMV